MAAAVPTATPGEAAPMVNGGGSGGAADEENWVEVSGSGGSLQTAASEAAVSSDPQWQQVAPPAEQNWTYIDASGFESIAVYNGILIAPPPTQVTQPLPPQVTQPLPPPLPSQDAVFRPRGSRGGRGGGGGGGRGQYNRGISNNVAR